MSQRRRFLRLAALTVTVSLAAAALTSPAYAALANIDIGGGTVVDNHPRAATPQQVSPGNVAGFYLWLRNEDTAGLPTFFMNANVVSTMTPLGAYWTNDPEEGPFNPCFIDGTLQCNFGGIDAGESIFITAAFTLPSGTSTSMANCKPTVNDPGFGPTTQDGSWRCVDFAFAANQGNVPGKNKSRGDIYHWYDYVATNTGSDSGAQFPFCDRSHPDVPCNTNLLTVLNTTGANKSNVQSTKLVAPAAAFNSSHGTTGLAVADNFAFECPVTLARCRTHEGDDFLGQWSRLDVNSEADYDDTFENMIHATLTMYGVNPNQIDGVVHIWQKADGTWDQRDITTKCRSASGPDPNADPVVECFWASGSGNVATVDVWTFNNGYHRTF